MQFLAPTPPKNRLLKVGYSFFHILGSSSCPVLRGGNQWRATTKMIETRWTYSMNVNVYQSLSHCLGELLHVLCSCKYSNRVFVSTCEPAKGKQENPISVYWLKGRDSKNGWFQNPCKQGSYNLLQYIATKMSTAHVITIMVKRSNIKQT